ncbi:MAG: hypothetical protein IPK15_23650 [Verrucomicrobia bacterium]|nr:hypothetical protein [Verrucomicrobiota bacterium]
MKSNIEIVRRIPVVSESVDELAIEAALDGRSIRVLDPVSLLACKLELVASVPLGKTARCEASGNARSLCERFCMSFWNKLKSASYRSGDGWGPPIKS